MGILGQNLDNLQIDTDDNIYDDTDFYADLIKE